MNKNLDFLRAVAVLLVAGGHALAFFGITNSWGHVFVGSFGKLGVYIFFVHTSLVLMQSLERSPGARSFMVRRVFRIYPLAAIAIGTVVIFRLPQGLVSYHRFTAFPYDSLDVFSNLFLVEAFSMRSPILGPTWSLTYELLMYLFLPFLFSVSRSVNRALAIYFVVLLTSIALNHSHVFEQNIALANFIYFAPCFLPGVAAYHLLKTKEPKLPAFCWPVFVIVIVLIYSLASEYLVYAFCALLGLSISWFSEITFKPLVLASHYVAKYSYGIYLAHFVCIYFAFEVGARLPFPAQVTLFIALLVSIPVVLYHTIEAPMIAIGKRITEVRLTIKEAAVAPSE